MSIKAKSYIYCIVAAGAVILGAALWHAHFSDPLRYAVYLALALSSSTLKLRLPRIHGTYSFNFVFLLVGILYFTLAETLLAGCAAALVQCLFHTRKWPTLQQILFNIANLVLSIAVCFGLARGVLAGHDIPAPASLSLIAFLYFVVNTGLVSGVLAMLHDQPLRHSWEPWYEWSLPYYLMGAVLVGLVPLSGHVPGPQSLLLLPPLLYLVHFFYSLSAERRAPVAPANWQAAEATEQRWPFAARGCIATVIAGGFLMLILAAWQLQVREPRRFLTYLAAAALAATFKIRLPGMTGTMSLGFVLILEAIADLSFAEAVLIAAVTALVQCLWKARQRPQPLQVFYSMAALALSSALAFVICRIALGPRLDHSAMGMAVLSTLLLYGSNTLLISLVLGLIQRQPLSRMWRVCYFWSFPYYLVGAAAVSLMLATSQAAGWQPALLVLPATLLVFVSYRIHVARAAQLACA